MQVKTISYERVLNLGNYENKKLALFAEVQDAGNLEAEISELMEITERKIREQADLEVEAKDLRREIRQLQKELEQLKAEKDKLTGEEEPDPDQIPFDGGEASKDGDTSPEDINKYF